MTGLPPTVREVEAFERDRKVDAYERLVERLLASPHCGEKWGRQWLDGARIRSCGHARDDNLPDNVWQCQFTVPRPGGGTEDAAIRWTVDGQATVPAGPGAYRVQYLDGHDERLTPGAPERITEQPVLIRSNLPKVVAQPHA